MRRSAPKAAVQARITHCRISAVYELLKAAAVIPFIAVPALKASVACAISFINLPPLKYSMDGTPPFAPRGKAATKTGSGERPSLGI
jgi:hypothetical protein